MIGPAYGPTYRGQRLGLGPTGPYGCDASVDSVSRTVKKKNEKTELQ